MSTDINGPLPDRLTFPPFPNPPPNVQITPFASFKQSGIQLRLLGDGVELDGLGIPTVELKMKHGYDAGEEGGKRRKKRKKGGAIPGGGFLQRPWWEIWAEGEDLRIGNYDLDQSPGDRIFQAAHDFHVGRPWPTVSTGLQNLWDQYRLYLGLLAHPNQPSKKKKKAIELLDGAGDDEDVVYSDEEGIDDSPRPPSPLNPDPANPDQIDAPNPTTDPTEEDQPLPQTPDRLTPFLNDPERNTKIFLSSYFRDKGMVWSEPKSRDAGLLIGFWLRFLIRNGVLKPVHGDEDGEDIVKKLWAAVAVADLAKKELPASHGIAKVLPCAFNLGCKELWGSQLEKFELSTPLVEAEVSEVKPEDEEMKEEGVKAFEEALAKEGVKIILAKDVEKELASKEREEAMEDNLDPLPKTGDTGGWGTGSSSSYISPSLNSKWDTFPLTSTDPPPDPDPTPTLGGWGSGGWGASSTTGGGWGDPSAPAPGYDPWNPSDPANKPNWDDYIPTSLTTVLGPSRLPLTHETGVVEWSARRIVGFEKPKKVKRGEVGSGGGVDAVERDLEERFGKMVLAPWLGWNKDETSEIRTPVILPKSKGKVVSSNEVGDASGGEEDGGEEGHDPFNDNITVLVLPSALEKLVVGMGLGATWIQVVRQGSEGSRKDGDGRFWYLEQLMHVIPSFYSEE
ncbi:hypothetical protein JAAARDRAFT_74885 [Jaapia argillacea MUCL 33604]|uniref:Uncharacterized protein n=1 Tax=Jaapia argillacea MUCL 33604 TaxID=933084 RepID=A0A067QN61_9AGAM|nr:hypothetical protein JAAARDRAFT_74885 [Jaapia argillacea MUCL 33604]